MLVQQTDRDEATGWCNIVTNSRVDIGYVLPKHLSQILEAQAPVLLFSGPGEVKGKASPTIRLGACLTDSDIQPSCRSMCPSHVRFLSPLSSSFD